MIQEKTILFVEDISLNPRGPRWHPPREYFFLDGLGPGAGFRVGRQPEYAALAAVTVDATTMEDSRNFARPCKFRRDYVVRVASGAKRNHGQK